MIGGGLAGLASAVALAEAGLEVRLLEKRPHLGGRATSYTLPDGSEVDNCQHVTLGCCTNLADFYRRARRGREDPLLRPPVFRGPRGPPVDDDSRRGFRRRCTWRRRFFFSARWRLADKRASRRALLAIARAGGQPPRHRRLSMLDWLHRMKQTPDAIERFWRVVLVSALDEELARTDARYGIDVFWKAFLGNRDGLPRGHSVRAARRAV